MRPGEGQNRSIARDERRAVEKALRATGKVRSILDVGAGNGRWLPVLATKRRAAIVSLDSSPEQLLAGRSGKDVPALVGAVRGDAGALPFPPRSFDLIFCHELMPYVRKGGRLRALREMRRVSSRWVIVQYRHREGLAFLWQRLRRRVGLEASFPLNHVSRGELEAELRRAGLAVRGVAPVGGRFSRSWVILAESPSPDWMKN